MPCFTTETTDYHTLAVTAPPSMFRDFVPYFSSVPFRSAPFRGIVTRVGLLKSTRGYVSCIAHACKVEAASHASPATRECSSKLKAA